MTGLPPEFYTLQKGIVGIRAEGLTGNHRPMKRFFREVEAIWRRTLHRRSQKAGMFMPRFLRLLRRFPLPEPTILNPYRSVIQELTKSRHESQGSPSVKLYLFAGIGKKTQTRTKVLNGDLEETFRRWYPAFRSKTEAKLA